MGLLSWIVLGLIVGAVAKLIVPGDDPGGCLTTIVIGMAGAVIGGFVGAQLGLGGVDGFDVKSLFLATGGSILLLLGYRALQGRKG